jgi:ATP-dependent Clp protease protease subunit
MRTPYIFEKSSREESERAYDPFSRMLKDRIIFISGEFNQDMADLVVAQLLFLETDDSGADIYMYINSPGGQITAMYAIYDTMNYIKPDIVTIGYGQVASAGSFILTAGTKGKRYALPNCEIMIHELSTGVQGKAGDIFQTMEHTKKLYDKMASQYSVMTGQDVGKVKVDMHRDYFMSSEEAKIYGLIDQVEYKRK